ncbi:MAG: sel1 repeat family protein [Alphaproteobacteria bacterium]|nr:sel1 repeat family protein [Alphaproteobacteria bacterium]
MLLLAKLHALGKGVPADVTEARWWAQRAILGWIDNPPTDRRERLASAMENDVPMVIQQEFDRIELIMAGSLQEKFEAAGQIEHGNGFKQDPQRACLWRLSAAKDGLLNAQMALAQQLLDGRGVRKNPERGIEWLHRAAAGGSPDAQAQLGRNLTNGQFGVRKDFRSAYRWLSRAKTAGLEVEDIMADAAAQLKPDTIHSLQQSAFEVTPGVPKMIKDARVPECD